MLLDYDIQHGEVPAIYELGVGEANKSLIVRAHGDGWEYVSQLLSQLRFPLRDSLQEELELPLWKIPKSETDSWGFGGNMIGAAESRPNWRSWEYRLPQAGKELDYPKLYAGSASLNVLFRCLGLIEECSGYPKPQLLHANLHTARGFAGGSLSVALGKSLLPWLSSQPDSRSNHDIQQVMADGYKQMRGESRLFDDSFKAWFTRPYWLNLTCPGDACGLDPEDHFVDEEGEGYKLTSHNVDSPLQQLTLLMGVAAIHDEARKAGY